MTTFIETFKNGEETVINAIEGVFTTLKGELEDHLAIAAGAIAEAINTQAPGIDGSIVTFLDQNALAAVAAAEAMPGGGQAKMTAALVTFGAALATKGLTLAETLLRMLIETALIKYKAKTAPAVTASVAAS